MQNTDMIHRLAMKLHVPAVQFLNNRDCPAELSFEIAQAMESGIIICSGTTKYYTTSAMHSNAPPFTVIDEKNANKIAQSMHWFLKAAGKGHAQSQYHIGMVYKSGKTVQQDYSKAAAWFLKAAGQGYIRAYTEIASLYHHGRAVELFTIAADKGDAAAQCHLAECYQHGYGTSIDYYKAMTLYDLAQAQGYPMAKYKRLVPSTCILS